MSKFDGFAHEERAGIGDERRTCIADQSQCLAIVEKIERFCRCFVCRVFV
jgi:hypothetical protein